MTDDRRGGPAYKPTTHERALEVHNERWEDMHAMRLAHGTGSPEYRQARDDMLTAWTGVKEAARA